MIKDFDTWNELKQHIHITGVNGFYREREIWWCALGINIGFEEDGKGPESERPVLVIKGFSKQLCIVVPLSTSMKKSPYYVPIGIVDDKPATAMISHIRSVDPKRFINRISYLDQTYFDLTKQAIRDML